MWDEDALPEAAQGEIMARSRMIKPDFWDDEKLAGVSMQSRLVFIALLNYSDDYGVVRGNNAWLKNKIFPFENIELSKFSDWVQELKSINVIIPFTADSEMYLYIKNFAKHQKINRPSETRNPKPPQDILMECSWSAHGVLMDEVEEEEEEEREVEIEEEEESVKGETSSSAKRTQVSSKRKIKITEEEWLTAIKANPAYEGLNIEAIKGKCEAWCMTKGKVMTRARLLNWLNREDKPLSGGNGKKPYSKNSAVAMAMIEQLRQGKNNAQS